MVDEYITTVYADNTIGMSVLWVAIGVLIFIIGAAFVVTIMTNQKHRSNSLTWYKDQVIAFKVGYIIKKAKEEGIELTYPPKTDLGKALEEQISKDIDNV